ncbi:hypothetical protein [Actinomadura sp. WMMB 499]|uniref:hypothetical protein n=1 Tax=Actinomadura sp. WMMB 499 TaxID=1219491 RepID=UPI001248B8BB|nr:hypothetical protein [Actinomadura sp. WMMB 499]QFG24097.1 hypothetical protein F7P10_26195 [Actinomadura sp. WMMB 499]
MPQLHDETFGPRAYIVEVGTEPAEAGSRNTIGGSPVLAAGQAWPSCYCGGRMAFYFQVGIPADVPTFGGHQLLVFQCPLHDEACFSPGSRSAQLPGRFWDDPPEPNEGAFWRILLHGGGNPVTDSDPFLQPRRLTLAETPDERGNGRFEFKVSGVPAWAQDPERYRCPCGADLAFVCQIPEDFEFEMLPGRPEDFGELLFLGNMVYILACPERCDPAAAWPVNQN